MNKTNLFISSFLALFINSGISAQVPSHTDKFTLTGKLSGRDTGIIVLKYLDKSWKYVQDTAVVKQGRFEFKGDNIGPTNATLIGDTKSNIMEGPGTATIFLEPSEMSIEVTAGDFQHLKITGSQTQNEFQELKKSEEDLFAAFDSIKRERKKVIEVLKVNADSATYNQKMGEIEQKIAMLSKAYGVQRYNFVKNHTRSFLSPYILQALINTNRYDIVSWKQLYNSLDPKVQSSNLGILADQQIKSKEAAVAGNKALNFSAKDINGKSIELSQFKGKSHVLLDFWASWCGPCHKQAPYLNRLHDKFKNKGLEIISISSDHNRDYWKDAISKDSIGRWTNLLMSDAYVNEKEESLSLKFAITAYPTLVLIDKNGLIVYRRQGFSGAADAMELKNKIGGYLQ